jgi:hypothetical protein
VAWRPRLRRSPIRPPADGDGDPPPPPPPPRGAHATTSRRPRRRRGGAARTRGRTDGWHQHREQCVRAWWWGKPRPNRNRNRLSFPRATPARERPPITCPPAQASLSAPGWGRVPPPHHTTPHHTTPGGWDGCTTAIRGIREGRRIAPAEPADDDEASQEGSCLVRGMTVTAAPLSAATKAKSLSLPGRLVLSCWFTTVFFVCL